MSLPTVFDFAILKIGDGATPEVFTAICGLTDVVINETAETVSNRRRDCATPNKPGTNKIKVLGTAWTITGSGLPNAAQETTIRALLGKHNNYKVEGYADDSTDSGSLIGTYSGRAVMSAKNLNMPRDSESSVEFTFEGEGALAWLLD